MLDAPRLNGTQFDAAPPGQVSRTVAEEFVDHRNIEMITDDRAKAMCGRAKEMQDAVDQSLIHEFVHNILGKPGYRFNENKIVDLIEVPLVLEHTHLQLILLGSLNI